jgi:adenylate cyclase, class 2
MPRNIETKRICTDLARVRSQGITIGAFAQGKLLQTDTYFVTNTGKLKLREIAGAAQAELIRYERELTGQARASDYTIEHVDVRDVERTIHDLSRAAGVRCVVKKSRELLLWRNVRIHLDTVEQLGTFVELESVVSDHTDEPTARKNFDEVFAALQLGAMPEELRSYGDLLAASSHTIRADAITPSPPARR